MEASPIHELLPGFKERNQVIFMLLGLLSLSQDWMRLLESQAEYTRLYETRQNLDLVDEPTPDDGSPETSTRGFLYFLLGTVSFTDHFTRTLDSARASATASSPTAPPAPMWDDLGDVLR